MELSRSPSPAGLASLRLRQARALRDGIVLVFMLASYWLAIFPLARTELRRWHRRAERIPDPELRRIACATVEGEGLNAEGAALFAMLAPLCRRRAATRLLVRFQLMYDYLDALTEPPVPNPLRSSRQLHLALLVALGGAPPPDGYFAHHPLAGDGGYLAELADACWRIFARLPSAASAAPAAIEAARRSAEAQSQNHAAANGDEHDLLAWAEATTPSGSGLRWWETAAAAESSLLMHVLLASAAHSELTDANVNRIAAAYWPWVTGLNALLDDLVDTAEDAAAGTHSFVAHYESGDVAAARLATIARAAGDSLRSVPLSVRQRVILAAMTSYYLAAPEAAEEEVTPVARQVQGSLDLDLRMLLAMLRLRRWLYDRTSLLY